MIIDTFTEKSKNFRSIALLLKTLRKKNFRNYPMYIINMSVKVYVFDHENFTTLDKTLVPAFL